MDVLVFGRPLDEGGDARTLPGRDQRSDIVVVVVGLVVFEALSGRIAAQLNIPTNSINPGDSLSEFGIDSTDAVDLRNWISRTMESTVPILEILASGSVFQLVGHIVSRSQLLNLNDETS